MAKKKTVVKKKVQDGNEEVTERLRKCRDAFKEMLEAHGCEAVLSLTVTSKDELGWNLDFRDARCQ